MIDTNDPATIISKQQLVQSPMAMEAHLVNPYGSSSSSCHESSASSEGEQLDSGGGLTILSENKRRSDRLLMGISGAKHRKKEVFEQQLNPHSPRSFRLSILFAYSLLHHTEGLPTMQAADHPDDSATADDIFRSLSTRDLYALSDMYRNSSCFIMLGEFRKLLQSGALNEYRVWWSMRSHALQLKQYGEDKYLKTMLEMQASLLGLKGWEEVLSLEEDDGLTNNPVTQHPHCSPRGIAANTTKATGECRFDGSLASTTTELKENDGK